VYKSIRRKTHQKRRGKEKRKREKKEKTKKEKKEEDENRKPIVRTGKPISHCAKNWLRIVGK
jgi:hypothetical protein